MAVAAIATPKTIVTIRPEVVRLLSLCMQTSAPAVSVKQIIPAAHDAISVVVAKQVEVPDVVWQTDVDFVEVTEQAAVPVVVAEVVDPVLVVVALDEVEVVDEAVVAVEEVESVVVESAVVVADVLATVVLEVFALVVVADVVFSVVLSAVVLSADVEPALLLKSPLPLSNGWQSFANQTASMVASPTPHPFKL